MNSINGQFMVSIAIIVLSYLFKRMNLIKEQDGESIARLLFNITLPALIICTFSTVKIDSSLVLMPVIGVIYGLLMAVIGVVYFKKTSRNLKGMLTMLLPGCNIGLFAFPLVQAIWGEEGLKYFGMYDMGNAMIVFGVCYIIGSYFSSGVENINYKNILLKSAKSIPLLTYISVLIINVLGVRIPDVILNITTVVSKANTPLSLLLLGVYLNFSFDSSYWKSIIKVVSLRYSVGLAIGIACFIFLPLESMFKYTLLIVFILPIATTVIPYAIEFDYDEKLVGTLTNITILISFSLIWVIVGITQ